MQQSSKPYAESCDQNRAPIRAVLEQYLSAARSLLEIGSGTGQHAVAFAEAFPHLRWQPSDRSEHLPGIRLWVHEANLPNLPEPLELDVTGTWPEYKFDAMFSANTAHIMSSPQMETLFRGLRCVLTSGGIFALYGPFNYGGERRNHRRVMARFRDNDVFLSSTNSISWFS